MQMEHFSFFAVLMSGGLCQDDINMANLLFVYGTLLSICGNHHHLSQFPTSRLIGRGASVERYCMYDHIAYPYVDPEVPHSKIQGELWLVDDEAKTYLDEFEGHPSYYRRETVSIELLDEIDSGTRELLHAVGNVVLAEMYLKRGVAAAGIENLVLVDSGNYLDAPSYFRFLAGEL